jgi:uncharacterized membrane protein HdeD (DUF308 family)
VAATLAELRAEWHRFKDDKPGERFRNHNVRAQERSKQHAAVTIALGVLLLTAGVILLFMPGPGTPLIIFGVALVAAHSKKMSGALDRTEPKLRERGRRVEQRWKVLPRPHKIAVITGGILLVTAALLVMWDGVVAAYVL